MTGEMVGICSAAVFAAEQAASLFAAEASHPLLPVGGDSENDFDLLAAVAAKLGLVLGIKARRNVGLGLLHFSHAHHSFRMS